MSIRDVGSYIGFNRVTSTSQNSASGIWSLAAAERRVRAAAWPPVVDPYYENVSLLLHMNGANNSTTFIDSGPGNRTVTAAGDVRVTTAQSKFGGASAVFDGTDPFLSVPNNAAFDFGFGDFAIEVWIYIAGNSAPDNDGAMAAAICNTWNAGVPSISGWILGIMGNNTTTGTGLFFDSYNQGSATLFRVTEAIPQSTWHHVVFSVSGGTRRIFLNGNLLTNTTSTTRQNGYPTPNSLGSGLRIGRTQNPAYPLGLNGYIDDLRITKGSARGYTTSTILVPAEEFR